MAIRSEYSTSWLILYKAAVSGTGTALLNIGTDKSGFYEQVTLVKGFFLFLSS
jgi:hypothetical protein